MTVGGVEGMVHTRTVLNRAEIPSLIFVTVPVLDIENAESEIMILGYYTLAAARQCLREMGEIV